MSVPEVLNVVPDGDDHQIVTIRVPVSTGSDATTVTSPTIANADGDVLVHATNLAAWAAGPVVPGEVLSDRLVRDLRNEAVRAHRKHVRPEHGGGSLVDPELPEIKKLAALVEEVGEVARLLTYDGIADKTEHLLPKDRDEYIRRELRKELIQVANVAATWAQSLNRDEVDP